MWLSTLCVHLDSLLSSQAILSRPSVPGRQGVHPVNTDTFQQLMHLKFMRSLAAPGEAVGVIAAQSVGETPACSLAIVFYSACMVRLELRCMLAIRGVAFLVL